MSSSNTLLISQTHWYYTGVFFFAMLFRFLHKKQAEVQSAPVTKATKKQKYE